MPVAVGQLGWAGVSQQVVAATLSPVLGPSLTRGGMQMREMALISSPDLLFSCLGGYGILFGGIWYL